MKKQIKKGEKIDFSRIWAMPNLWTFTIKPIRELLDSEVKKGWWCDPFSGRNSRANVQNDLVEKAHHNKDALTFLKERATEEFDGVLYDPPYSITQARNYGSKKFASMKYWKECKDEVARVTRRGGGKSYAVDGRVREWEKAEALN